MQTYRGTILYALALRVASACRGPAVTISGTAGEKESSIKDVDGSPFNSLTAKYGDDITDITVLCSGTDSKNLIIELEGSRNNEKVTTEIVNENTVKVTSKNLNVYFFYLYACTDLKNNCTAKLLVSVIPDLTVKSDNVRYKRTENKDTYFVPVGEDYEVMCSGNAALAMDQGTFIVRTIKLNENTIVTDKENKNSSRYFYYTCKHEPEFGQASIDVVVDHPPVAKNFWCVQDDLQINCHWNSISDYATFTIYYVDPDRKSMRIYEDHIVNKKNRSSEWSMTEIWHNGLTLGQNLTFVVQSCNYVYCSNETYHIDRDYIMKTKSPTNLKLLEVNSQSAVLTWREQDPRSHQILPKFDFKVTYQLPGLTEQELNTSSLLVTCKDSFKYEYYIDCKGEIKLPCPGKLYNIKVYSQFKQTPNKDVYWSEPVNINIQIQLANNTKLSPFAKTSR
ncbi:uncharacterized protein LOC125230438 [Leguminivora glycinivorella]|uniref:uncharacterized protein LOC125230438 n=1 Tax=Leguminivora glycinivorella TaxID=1035111 RepID=UPI0020109F0C|nr:uncharacterized protein LOC125230438 [Leguminivora glycinivorella]